MKKLYIYGWDFSLIDSVCFNKANNRSIADGFVDNTDGYITFSSNFNEKPDYYIDKSEIGTGNLKFHKIED